ncbi:MAG: hypothetical protein KDK40_05685, partial [Chlamydiia bacterium]|nr:hypothetical protein [Chlamydiia bacterium]
MGESFNPQYYGQQRVSLSEVAQESFAEFYATYTGPRTEDPSVSYLFRKVTKYTIGLPFYALLFVIDQLGQRLSESYKEKHDFFVKITKEDSVRQSIKDGIQVIRSAANNVLKTGTTSALDTSRSALISTLKSASHREILLACQKGYFEEANLKLNPDEKDESVAKKGDALLREQVKKAAEEGLAHIAKHYAEKNVESLARYSLDQKECNRLFGELNSKELGLERLIL